MSIKPLSFLYRDLIQWFRRNNGLAIYLLTAHYDSIDCHHLEFWLTRNRTPRTFWRIAFSNTPRLIISYRRQVTPPLAPRQGS
jgi:hypothetical protein